MNWLGFVLRWFHLVAAITAVGGTIFMRFALVPSIDVLSEEQRKALHEKIRPRWARLVAASVAFLLITGIWNFVSFLQESKSWGPEWRQSYYGLYQAVWGMKFAIALVIFFIASALAGRSEATKPVRQNARWWMTLNVLLALVVVALSGVLRMTHTGPTLPRPAPAATSETPAIETPTAEARNG